MSISQGQIIAAVKAMDEEIQQAFLENLLAATSPDYPESIRQVRNDYREGRIYYSPPRGCSLPRSEAHLHRAWGQGYSTTPTEHQAASRYHVGAIPG